MYFSVPFLTDDYEYYYDDLETPKNPVTQTPEFQPSPRWPSNTERFTEADVFLPPTTTWKPPTFLQTFEKPLKTFNYDTVREDTRIR